MSQYSSDDSSGQQNRKFTPLAAPETDQSCDTLQFHFSCCVLCLVMLDDDGRADYVNLLGFYRSPELADLAARGRETLLRAQHEAKYKVTNGRWPRYPWKYLEYVPNHYEIVSLKNVSFASLSDLENAIENAAKARVSGVGVEDKTGGAA